MSTLESAFRLSGVLIFLTWMNTQYVVLGYGTDPRVSDADSCPSQCRCIALSHLGYRAMAQRWESLGQLHGLDNTIWKGTEAPIWKEDRDNLRGRDMVCMGLSRIPKHLPSDLAKMTFFGDSSSAPYSKNTSQSGQYLLNQPPSQITEINGDTFQSNHQLRELTISGNIIYTLHPYSFRSLFNLQYLAIPNNNIRHMSAATFSGLHILKELRLSDNMIGYISLLTFNSLANLQYLYLNGNKLSKLNRGIFQGLFNLQYLDLSRNQFTDFYDNVFDDVANLKELHMTENLLWVIRPRWFERLTYLKKLELRGNIIIRVETSSFKTLSNLEYLTLSANRIANISENAFGDLINMKNLDLSRNDIMKLEPDCFAGLTAIDELDLSVNKISFVDNKTFLSTPKLRRLDMSDNEITDIEEAALRSLKDLQELDMSHNKLKTIRRNTFSGLVELRELNLEHNKITEIEDDAFSVASLNQLSKLTWLSLQYNKILQLSKYSLYSLPHLKLLNIGHNRLKSFHERTFYTLSSLRNLILNGNRLRQLPDGLFRNLKQVISLNLKGNSLEVITNDTLSGLKSLEDLNLESNNIENIETDVFMNVPKLTQLNLQDNKLSILNFTIMRFLANLRSIDLSGNHLHSVHFPKKSETNLHYLDLSDNRLESLSEDISNVIFSSASLALWDNPWSCDCQLRWLVENVRQYYIRLERQRETLCRTPSDLSGKQLTEVPPRQYQCAGNGTFQALQCDTVLIREPVGKEGNTNPVRRAKNIARDWHVSLRSQDNFTDWCNGMMLNENWAITRHSCMRSKLTVPNEKIRVKVGAKEERKILLSIDYPQRVIIPDYDISLIRLTPRASGKVSSQQPCVLTYSQYHQLSRATGEAVFSSLNSDSVGQRTRLTVRTGKIYKECPEKGLICLKMRGRNTTLPIEGVPLSLRYQGIWYFAGLGHSMMKDTGYGAFTPLWNLANWINSVIQEIDTKCEFKNEKGESSKLCKAFNIPGVTQDV
ncbi:hypothetical protein ACJMK2_019678 [Sinanodonta woodiana]|uniref:Peptidase S1 domain-containing protein n=1 Tax=Sinanodonta woodiana TaxID=1069815 RepID=A0ABD3TWM7_SINWO